MKKRIERLLVRNSRNIGFQICFREKLMKKRIERDQTQKQTA